MYRYNNIIFRVSLLLLPSPSLVIGVSHCRTRVPGCCLKISPSTRVMHICFIRHVYRTHNSKRCAWSKLSAPDQLLLLKSCGTCLNSVIKFHYLNTKGTLSLPSLGKELLLPVIQVCTKLNEDNRKLQTNLE